MYLGGEAFWLHLCSLSERLDWQVAFDLQCTREGVLMKALSEHR